jgi:hypothetical protein
MKRSTLIPFLYLIATLLLSITPLCINAQTYSITGVVTDSAKQPLHGASVTILNDRSLVIGYTSSNQYGNFKLPYFNKGVWINVSYVGFKSQKIKLDSSITHYNIHLVTETKILEDIVVKNRPSVKINGDTSTFLVRNFSTNEDRTIGDVLKRLPSLEIAEDGTIYHNGKKIENLYLEGDDVMDGRYGMATKVIKKELIKSVEIISHHQPIKVLKDKVFTDNVALNLVLQNENSLKLSGTSQIGIGAPNQIEASISPIILSKRLKLVSRAAYNNAGIDYSKDAKQLGNSNFIDNISSKQNRIDLSLNSVSPPDIPLNYYYFNKSSNISSNIVYKTKSDIQFKWNVNLYSDINRFNYNGQTLAYLANDTILYSDKQLVFNKPLVFNSAFNLMINKTQYFLNNSLKLSMSHDAYNGSIDFNRNSFEQLLNKNDKQISNDFNWMPSIKNKGIVEFRIYSSYGVNDQHLNVLKDYYFDITPQNGYYDTVKQSINYPTWFHNAYVSYKIPSEKVLQEYKFGYKYLKEELKSNLSIIKGGNFFPYLNDNGNNAFFTNSAAYFSAHYQIKKQKFRSDIQLPVSLQLVKSIQPFYSINKLNQSLLVLPNLNFTYNFDNEKYLEATYQLQNNFGDISSSYEGAILLNYRSLQSYSQMFQQQKVHKANLVYSHQKSIKLFYSNFGISYDYTIANTMLSDSFSNNINNSIFIPKPNSRRSVLLYSGLSQYIFDLKAKVGLKIQHQFSFTEQLVNNTLLGFQIRNLNFNISIDKNISKILNLNYNANLIWLYIKHSNMTNLQFPSTKSFLFDQKFKLSFNIFKHYSIETVGTHRINQSTAFSKTGFFFLDANIKRLQIRKGMDMELNCFNLFNVKNYSILQQNKNIISTNIFPTRGISLFLKFIYSF